MEIVEYECYKCKKKHQIKLTSFYENISGWVFCPTCRYPMTPVSWRTEKE